MGRGKGVDQRKNEGVKNGVRAWTYLEVFRFVKRRGRMREVRLPNEGRGSASIWNSKWEERHEEKADDRFTKSKKYLYP